MITFNFWIRSVLILDTRFSNIFQIDLLFYIMFHQEKHQKKHNLSKLFWKASWPELVVQNTKDNLYLLRLSFFSFHYNAIINLILHCLMKLCHQFINLYSLIISFLIYLFHLITLWLKYFYKIIEFVLTIIWSVLVIHSIRKFQIDYIFNLIQQIIFQYSQTFFYFKLKKIIDFYLFQLKTLSKKYRDH